MCARPITEAMMPELPQSTSEQVLPVSRATSCVVCEAAVAKYKCPKCGTQTCSVTCCTMHKQLSLCSGKRSRHEYVSACNYDESTMMSDYRLLEEGSTFHSSMQKEASRIVTGQNSSYRTRKGAQELLKAAARSCIDLKFMPEGMQRHTTNTTFFRRRDRCICWRVELRFPLVPTIAHLNGISESETVAQVLATAFSSSHGNAAQSVLLVQYTTATPALCDVFLQREQGPSSFDRMKRVEIQQTIGDAIRGERVIEFPIFIVQLQPPDSKPPSATSTK